MKHKTTRKMQTITITTMTISTIQCFQTHLMMLLQLLVQVGHSWFSFIISKLRFKVPPISANEQPIPDPFIISKSRIFNKKADAQCWRRQVSALLAKELIYMNIKYGTDVSLLSKVFLFNSKQLELKSRQNNLRGRNRS